VLFKRNPPEAGSLNQMQIRDFFGTCTRTLNNFYHEKKMSPEGLAALTRLAQIMEVAHLSQRSIVAYCREVRFMIEHYPDIDPQDWTEDLVISYQHYLITAQQASRSKCHMSAQSIAYFFRNVLQKPFTTPSRIYPKRIFQLPTVLTVEDVRKLLAACQSAKEQAILELFYSTGLRLNELRMLKMEHIEAAQNRVKVFSGKGQRDRYTLLSQKCLETLRRYFRSCAVKPKQYLFEGQTPGEPMHARSIQHAVLMVYNRAGLGHKTKKVHALRHSFATHLLDNGVDIHTIKELLGHSKIETTMVYLHLQSRKRNALISPLDVVDQPVNQLALIPKQTSVI
jgi:integrase/recombinase XerD